jgi:hypothetical protein
MLEFTPNFGNETKAKLTAAGFLPLGADQWMAPGTGVLSTEQALHYIEKAEKEKKTP